MTDQVPSDEQRSSRPGILGWIGAPFAAFLEPVFNWMAGSESSGGAMDRTTTCQESAVRGDRGHDRAPAAAPTLRPKATRTPIGTTPAGQVKQPAVRMNPGQETPKDIQRRPDGGNKFGRADTYPEGDRSGEAQRRGSGERGSQQRVGGQRSRARTPLAPPGIGLPSLTKGTPRSRGGR